MRRQTDGRAIFPRTVWEIRAGKQTEEQIFRKPSEKREKNHRRKNSFFANRRKSVRKITDGRTFFSQTVGKASEKCQTEEQFFREPSEKCENRGKE
jgi:hypothetical protein